MVDFCLKTARDELLVEAGWAVGGHCTGAKASRKSSWHDGTKSRALCHKKPPRPPFRHSFFCSPPLLSKALPECRDTATAHGQDPVDRWVELDLPTTVGGRPDLPHSTEIDRPTSVDHGEAEGLEGIEELAER